MKKFLILAAATLALCACAGKQYTYADLVFDLPSFPYEQTLPENVADNTDPHLFFIEDGIENSLEFGAYKIYKEEPEDLKNTNAENLGAILALEVYGMLEITFDDKDYTILERPESPLDVKISYNADGIPEAHAVVKANYGTDKLFAESYSTVFDGRYIIVMYSQALSESALAPYLKTYRSVHLKQ